MRFVTEGLAIDLGSSRTRIHAPGRGIVLDEPSTIAIDRVRGEVAAVGQAADNLRGREPVDLHVLRPVRGGAIENVDAAEKMLSAFARQARSGRWRGARFVIGVPGSSTPIEQRAVRNAAFDARAVRVDLIDSGLASALGADADSDGRARLVVDIGSGTTDVAAVVDSFILVSASVKVGGDAIDAAISDYVRASHGIVVGERTAEAAKRLVGAAAESGDDAQPIEIVGKRLGDGFPCAVKIRPVALREAVQPVLERIVSATRQVVESLPPDATCDLYEIGGTLTGGVAQMRGIGRLFEARLGLRFGVATDPLHAAAAGAGRVLAQPQSLGRVALRESVLHWQYAKSLASA